MSTLSHARYGKDNVRVCKVTRHADSTHSIAEFTVRTLLEGDIAASWTHADNANIVATDTQKHTVYVLAKQHSVDPPEEFAAVVAQHFLTEYAWISRATVDVIVHRWTRFEVDGKTHAHSFVRDGEEKRLVTAVASRGPGAKKDVKIEIASGIKDLLVLKTTGSQFWGFHRDAYTRLPETRDRILSTAVEARWHWRAFDGGVEEVKRCAGEFNAAYDEARRITLETFAKEDSPSVQNTMYIMCEQILGKVKRVEKVDYQLPNKHYFEIDLSWFKGLKNTGKDAEVYAPQSDPNGLIQCTVERGSKGRL